MTERTQPEGEPHMAVVDPFISLRDWRSVCMYRVDPAVVDQFLAGIDATLLPGWVRDHEFERTRSRPDYVRCYMFDRPGDAALRVWLQRVTATRVRGGPVQVLRHPPSGDAVRIGRLVAEFADGCVLSAASAAGVRCTRPAFGPRSAITPAAEMLLPGSRTRTRRGVATTDREKGCGTRSSPAAWPSRSPSTGPSWDGGLWTAGCGAGRRHGTCRPVIRGLRVAGQAVGRHGPMTTQLQAAGSLRGHWEFPGDIVRN